MCIYWIFLYLLNSSWMNCKIKIKQPQMDLLTLFRDFLDAISKDLVHLAGPEATGFSSTSLDFRSAVSLPRLRPMRSSSETAGVLTEALRSHGAEGPLGGRWLT